MARRKCVVCGEEIIGESGVPYKGRYSHQKCFEIAIKTLQKDKTEKLQKSNKKTSNSKPKAELKEAVTEEEYRQKTQLYNYLRSITENNQLNSKVYPIIEGYIKRYGYTFLSIYNTLVYLNEYTDKVLTGDIVGIVPYYHDEAQAYFESIKKIETNNEAYNLDEMYKEKVIQVPINKKRSYSVKQIDISKI